MGEILFFISVALALAGQFFDSWTTEVGIAHGAKETVGPSAWVISKFNVATLVILKCAGFAISAPMLLYILGNRGGSKDGTIAGIIVASVAAAVGLYAGVTNYRRLTAAKIAVF